MAKVIAPDVLIPPEYKPPKGDLDVARLLASYYKTPVKILRPINRYKVKTPDFYFMGQYFELKVMKSSQVRQLLVLLKRAYQQSNNIIIDLRKTKITPKRATEICQQYAKGRKKCRILIIVTAKSIIDIS